MSAWIAAIQVLTPTPVVPATAPADQFSGERAFTYLDVIAREPHIVGPPALDRVQEYLVKEIRALGLTLVIQNATATLPGENRAQAGSPAIGESHSCRHRSVRWAARFARSNLHPPQLRHDAFCFAQEYLPYPETTSIRKTFPHCPAEGSVRDLSARYTRSHPRYRPHPPA